MIWNYITYIIFAQGVLGILGNLFLFPFAYWFRVRIRKNQKPKLLWWLLHDATDLWGDYGNMFTNPELKKNLYQAWRWAWRNPIHNYMTEHGITEGKHQNFTGKASCHFERKDYGIMWRTLKTCDSNWVFQDKEGKWIDTNNSVLGKQSICFEIVSKGITKKVFRWSYAKPVHLWKNLYWVPEFKFGWESVNWAWQSHFFIFKRYSGKFSYYDIVV